jgi:alkanesulfonate monooxygenase SsuD/methylene tetrahydromethanopterin reductase-like flavin-dependent oxidoreductase (luciferase family)
MRMLPHPVKPIPIWIGASSEAALTRAVKLAEGWHGSRLSPEEAAPTVRRIREQRPGAGFAISLRYGWDGKDEGALRACLAAYGTAGVEHVLVEPAERALKDWLRRGARRARGRAARRISQRHFSSSHWRRPMPRADMGPGLRRDD